MSYQTFEITGVIVDIEQEKKFSEKYSERTIVLEYESSADYKYKVALTLANTKMGLIDAFAIGQKVVVNFNISSREVNGNYYTKLNVWKVDYAR